MNNKLITLLQQQLLLSEEQSATAINIICKTIMDTVARGETFTLDGFGSFRCHERQATMGRHPISGEEIVIPARRLAIFRAAQQFQQHLKNPLHALQEEEENFTE